MSATARSAHPHLEGPRSWSLTHSNDSVRTSVVTIEVRRCVVVVILSPHTTRTDIKTWAMLQYLSTQSRGVAEKHNYLC